MSDEKQWADMSDQEIQEHAKSEEKTFYPKPAFKHNVVTHIEIPFATKIQVTSKYDMMTMFLEEGADTSAYEHLDKGPCFRPSGLFYLPRKALKRKKTFGGGLVVYDWDNSKRHFYNNFNSYVESIKPRSNFFDVRKDAFIIKDILPRLIKGEFVEVVQWIYPYFYYRV